MADALSNLDTMNRVLSRHGCPSNQPSVPLKLDDKALQDVRSRLVEIQLKPDQMRQLFQALTGDEKARPGQATFIPTSPIKSYVQLLNGRPSSDQPDYLLSVLKENGLVSVDRGRYQLTSRIKEGVFFRLKDEFLKSQEYARELINHEIAHAPFSFNEKFRCSAFREILTESPLSRIVRAVQLRTIRIGKGDPLYSEHSPDPNDVVRFRPLVEELNAYDNGLSYLVSKKDLSRAQFKDLRSLAEAVNKQLTNNSAQIVKSEGVDKIRIALPDGYCLLASALQSNNPITASNFKIELGWQGTTPDQSREVRGIVTNGRFKYYFPDNNPNADIAKLKQVRFLEIEAFDPIVTLSKDAWVGEHISDDKEYQKREVKDPAPSWENSNIISIIPFDGLEAFQFQRSSTGVRAFRVSVGQSIVEIANKSEAALIMKKYMGDIGWFGKIN